MGEKEIYYWSPFASNVATITAVLNSAKSLQKYSNGKIKTTIINALGEWNIFKDSLKKNNIKLFNLNKNKLLNDKKIEGFIQSRIIFIFIFLKCFFSLKKILIQNKPEYLVIHLLTSLPLFLYSIFKFETKLILRISGLPNMNLIRKQFWKFTLKNVYKITCPTEATKNDLIKLNICEKEKIYVLHDPIIKISEVVKKKKDKIDDKFNYNYFISIGRLTKQKNFAFLLDCFKKLVDNDNRYKLVIIGAGEDKNKLTEKINKLNLNNNVEMLGYVNNVYPYLAKAECFFLSSLWEDPGFVLVEAAASNTLIISSNCKNGPSEILDEGKGGYLYQVNSEEDFLNKFNEFKNNAKEINLKKKIVSKKNVKKFTFFKHYLNFINILQI